MGIKYTFASTAQLAAMTFSLSLAHAPQQPMVCIYPLFLEDTGVCLLYSYYGSKSIQVCIVVALHPMIAGGEEGHEGTFCEEAVFFIPSKMDY